jgi:DAK2 domain fusion protein YloV
LIPRAIAIAVIESALAAVEGERQLINDLNVYPVPDGDTGTNLALTVRAVLDELERSDAEDIPSVASAVTKGSLMGARGNSGVILSQIVRGVCEVWSEVDRLETTVFKRALAEGQAAAYRAVKEPVEGTMLTVVRAMSAAAQGVGDDAGLDVLLAVVDDAAGLAVERTTDQLPVLKKAGVVDAGGYGLLVLFRGLAARIEQLMMGGVAAPQVHRRRVVVSPVPLAGEAGAELSRYRYCTSFLLKGEDLDGAAFERFLEPLGDSALVVGDERMVKVHVHTDDPGIVLSKGVALGSIAEVEINDMHAQTRARDERLRAAGGAERTTVAIAVVAGEGNKRLFEELGCGAIVDGGQSMNPSAAQLLEAVERLGVDEVVLLPNNGNVVLTAEQAAGMSPRHVAVVPSDSIPAGLAAMVAFDPTLDAVDNARAMEAALEGLHSAEITRAVRDSEVDGVRVSEGQTIGIVDGALVATGDDLEQVFVRVLETFASADAEQVTVLTALNGSGTSLERLAGLAGEVAPALELHFHEGGQPLYPILASAE